MKFSVRDLLWMMTLAAVVVIWQRDRVLWSLAQKSWNAERRSLLELRNMRGVRVASGQPGPELGTKTPSP